MFRHAFADRLRDLPPLRTADRLGSDDNRTGPGTPGVTWNITRLLADLDRDDEATARDDHLQPF